MVTTFETPTTWAPTTHADYDALRGRDVYSRDGEKLGTIEAIFHPEQPMPQARGAHYFLVKPGALTSLFGGGEGFYVPEAAIAMVNYQGAILTFAKDTLEAQDWNRKPAGLEQFRRA